MNNKRFTLAEIVVVITVLAILLAIVLVQFGDLKKRSVHSAMSSNVRILQSSVDTYHLKYDKYPTKKESTLAMGQLIDVEELVEKGLLKKDLDTSKIKTQYYWVDVFGRVWGDTVLPPTKVNVIEKSDKRTFEFTLEPNVSKYHIYEVSGYNDKSGLSYNQVDIQKPKENTALADSSKYYRLIKSTEVSISEPTGFVFEGENKNSVYLISIEDDYGLESIPVGLTENKFFSPLINYEGTRMYEIEGSDLMYWVDFFTFEKKPAGSSITYKFKVKDEHGVYGEFIDDFYSLPPSKGIIVEVTMKGNSKKEKPSLYDLRVLYNYGEGGTGILPNPPLVFPKGETDPIPPNDTDVSRGGGEGAGTGTGSGDGEGAGTGTGTGSGDGEGSDTGTGTGTGGTGVGTGGGNGGGSTSGSNPENICPAGYGVTNIKSDGSAIDPSKEKQLSYLFVLNSGESIETITSPLLSNAKILDTIITYAALNGEGGYVEVDYVGSIPSNSCVNILYVLEVSGIPKIPVPPIINVTPPKPVEVEIPEWTTIETAGFSGQSMAGENVKWNSFIKEDYVPANTRIVYTFSAIGPYGNWTQQVSSISELPLSSKVIVYAKLQVKTSELKNPEQEEPALLKAKLGYDSKEVELTDETVVNLSDIFYPVVETDSTITNSWFDLNSGTHSNIRSGQKIPIKWKDKGISTVNKAVEIKFLPTDFDSTLQKTSTLEVKVLDKDGKEMKFLGYNNDTGTYSSGTTHSRSSSGVMSILKFVLPENADSISVTGNTSNYVYGPNVYDMKFSNISSEPDDLTEFKSTSSDSKISLSWVKPSNVTEVEIYRGNVLIGISKGETFTDPAILAAETEYNYSFLYRDSYGNVKYAYDKEPFKVTTKSKPVLFYPMNEADKATTSTWFDGNLGTGAATKNKGEVTFIKWNVADYFYNGSLENKAIKINFKSYDVRTSTLNVYVYDKNGVALPFYAETDGQFVSGTTKSLTVTNASGLINFVLPENADRIGVSGTTANFTVGPSIMNIDFANVKSEPDTISDFTAKPTANRVTLNWTKPANVNSVDIYRDNVFIGRSTSDTFADPSVLISENTYSYHFIYKDASGNIKTAYIKDKLKVKTLSKPISFYAMNSADKLITAAWFDGNVSTGARVKDRGASAFVKWNVNQELYPDSLTGRTIRVYFAALPTRESNLTINVLAANGTVLFTKSASTTSTLAVLDFVMPANADRIEVKGTTLNNVYGPTILDVIVIN